VGPPEKGPAGEEIRLVEYCEFLEKKRIIATPVGFELPDSGLNPKLFPFQRAIVRWALRRGRAAIFADCGLGKTPMQLEWARHVVVKTGAPVLILAPLAVSSQTKQEGEKFGIPVSVVADQGQVGPGINITNYEKLHKFEAHAFGGIVLDESSLLKAYDGKTRTAIIDAFARTPYRLACTATPAPNDHMELGNHAEFLGIMSRVEMLSMFFVHDGGDTSKWRVKGHAQDAFWAWMATWAVTLRRPSDLGFDDTGFDLPGLTFHDVVLPSDEPSAGYLIPLEAQSLMERRRARRESLQGRVRKCFETVKADLRRSWIIWCDLNAEQDALAKMFGPFCVSIQGSTDHERRIELELRWRERRVPVLITKPAVFGFGMNWQHCARMAFVGLSDSYEQFYQAVRRCWRFGQKEDVHCHVITGEREGAVVTNIRRKEADAQRMNDSMLEHMKEITMSELRGAAREEEAYRTNSDGGRNWKLYLGDSCEVLRELEPEMVDYSIFSPPFSSLYTYSNSERDLGNCKGTTEFFEHFQFLLKDLYRVLRPGRLLSFHCMNLPTTKSHHGYIGVQDFRGDLIRLFEAAGFIYHSEVVIWKDPVTAMQRTKALGLLYKQLKKDSAMSRQGIPDYLVTMRKPGTNPAPVTKDPAEFPVDLWQRYASPVWMDINPSNTLQASSAREDKDEKHICPLQLEVIERAVALWTNPGDLVLSPFAGIGSEGYVSVKMGRRFVGVELKESYWRQATANLARAEQEKKPDLLNLMENPPMEATA